MMHQPMRHGVCGIGISGRISNFFVLNTSFAKIEIVSLSAGLFIVCCFNGTMPKNVLFYLNYLLYNVKTFSVSNKHNHVWNNFKALS